MSRMVFVSLPVADVERARDFFVHVGFTFDPVFSDRGTLCMTVNDGCRVILHRTSRFAGYAASSVADPACGREAVVAVSASSRQAVDRCANAALAHGGTALREPEDLGFVYSRTFCDLDGHAWEIVWMDASALAG